MANEENLKRGPVMPQGNPQAGLDAINANREQEKALLNMDDPDDITLELFKEASAAALRGLRKMNRGGKEPTSSQINATREARQLAEVCRDILRSRGAATEAERFFAEVASRITSANLAEGPRPVGAGAG